jgi:CheY-like chemotaxis protein
MLILHVEDSKTCAAMLRAQLRYYAPEATLVQCESIGAARKWLASRAPGEPLLDLAILDLALPEGHGAELLEQLEPHACQIVFVTAAAEEAPKGYRAVDKRSAWVRRALAGVRDTVPDELPPDLPTREYPPPRIPDLCPDEDLDR